jgi:Phage derived protein Gp49-like (DUF891)
VDEKLSCRQLCTGRFYTIEWAFNSRGRFPAEEVFRDLEPEAQADFLALFSRLAQQGQIRNIEKFKSVTGRKLFEFKKGSIRFYGDYRPGKRFLISHGVSDKKKWKARPEDLDKAERILAENDELEETQGGESP